MTRGTAMDVGTIISSAGELVGRTRLQKTVALLEMAGVGFGFSFYYHRFGPFSDDLVVAADRAVALNFAKEEEHRANWGGRYSIFRARERKASNNAARDALIDIAKTANAVALELAVTAMFLAKEGIEKPWAEVEELKPEKVDRNNLAEAQKLYAKFLNVKDIPVALPKLV